MAFQEQPHFRYEPLDKSTDSFRLCKLLPAESGAPIECELVHDTISNQAGVYQALSYTWGKLTDRVWIRINNKEFHIHANLLLALEAVRTADKEQLLWIDAICINQREIPERNHQVSLMGHIFGNAKRVLGWVGLAANDSDLLMDYAHKYYMKADMYEEELSDPKMPDPPQAEKEAAIAAFRSFSQRDYWRRAWIRQEIVLAKELTFYCGTKSVDGWNILVMAYLLYTRDEIWENQIPDLHVSRGKLQSGMRRDRLERLVLRFGRSDCHDRHDKIFSLLALAGDTFDRADSIVDYDVDAPTLYLAIMEYARPVDITAFIVVLQEILGVCGREMITYVGRILDQNDSIEPKSQMEELAINFVLSVLKPLLGQEPEPLGHDSAEDQVDPYSETLTQWHQRCLAYTKTHMAGFSEETSPLFEIEGTDFAILTKPMPWGLLFVQLYKKEAAAESNQIADGEIIWLPYNPALEAPEDEEKQKNLTQAMKHILDWDGGLFGFVATDQQRDRDESMKRTLQEVYGIDPSNPAVDLVLNVLLVLNTASGMSGPNICLTVCRYVLTTLYGYKLVAPRVYTDSQQPLVIQPRLPGQEVQGPNISVFEGRII